jgi:hypothetical protein
LSTFPTVAAILPNASAAGYFFLALEDNYVRDRQDSCADMLEANYYPIVIWVYWKINVQHCWTFSDLYLAFSHFSIVKMRIC